jgi:hypothetical protein
MTADLLLVKSDGCVFCTMFEQTWKDLSDFLADTSIKRTTCTFDSLSQIENPKFRKFAESQATYVPFVAFMTPKGKMHVFTGERDLAHLARFLLDKLAE